MDWAGTAVDYGCFAPVAAFVESFRAIGVPVTAAETRAHMGLTKVEEIRALFDIERVRAEFERKFGRPAGEEDVQARYAEFQRVLFASLEDYTDPIPGVVETISALRAQGIRIGSTTGYTRSMMDVVAGSCRKCQLLYLMQRILDANGILWQSDNRKSFRSGQTSPGCEGLQIYTDCIRNSCT